MTGLADVLAESRDHALLIAGRYCEGRNLWNEKITEGYMDYYEGMKGYQGLPYVEINDLKVCYKENR